MRGKWNEKKENIMTGKKNLIDCKVIKKWNEVKMDWKVERNYVEWKKKIYWES